MISTDNPATERSEIMREESRGDPLHESAETEEDVLERPQDFKENLLDKDFQPHQYSASSSHELPMEPRAKVVLSSGTHRIFSHFPKDQTCDICLRTKSTRAFTKFSLKDVNLETIIDTLSWYKIWLHNGYNLIRAKQELLSKHKRAYRRSWSRRGNQESFTLTIPWNSASLVKNYPGISVGQHQTDQKQMGLLREQCVG